MDISDDEVACKLKQLEGVRKCQARWREKNMPRVRELSRMSYQRHKTILNAARQLKRLEKKLESVDVVPPKLEEKRALLVDILGLS